ncbi:hypothetical protein D4764_09G0010090 [Takifugu flavidus]|uniref:Endonuclease/exonuclease/phosphatase domain-containing protein n=1 Tax=Takifugu flavidus TaxID=433684 RepID=A0A5C6MMH2_9TELE|nr:hypothetical protein D4764_09G0010090 [Takifugu flavidus]
MGIWPPGKTMEKKNSTNTKGTGGRGRGHLSRGSGVDCMDIVNLHVCDYKGLGPGIVSRDQLFALRSSAVLPKERPDVPPELRRRKRGCHTGVERRAGRRRYRPVLPSIYTRDQLMALRPPSFEVGEKPQIPKELRRKQRGTKAGVKHRMKRRRFKPCVPAVITGNVRSLANKMDELEALTRTQREYREASIMCFTETWLHGLIPDSNVMIAAFSTVNKRWNPEHIHVKERVCSPDVELIAIGLRPYYLPREFTNVIAITGIININTNIINIPPTGKADTACDVIHSVTADLQTKHPGAFILITGDFNHASLKSTLPTFHQYVQCSTRDSETLDLLYANVTSAYTSTALPPLGKSDHNLVLLSPSYTPVVQQQSVTVRTVMKWSDGAMDCLRDALETTN